MPPASVFFGQGRHDMNARMVVNTGLAMLLATTVVVAGGLIWLATAQPEVLMTLAVRALSVIGN